MALRVTIIFMKILISGVKDLAIEANQAIMKGFVLAGTIGGALCFWLGISVMTTLKLLFIEVIKDVCKVIAYIIWIFKTTVRDRLRTLRVTFLITLRLALVASLVFAVTNISIDYLTQTYLNFPEVEHSTMSLSRHFPSVTVCSGVPLVWDKQDLFLSEFNFMREQRLREENKSLELDFEEYVNECEYSSKGSRRNCSKDDFALFTNRKYGSCATFNHGLTKTRDLNQPIDELEMTLSWGNEYWTSSRLSSFHLHGPLVHLHSKGTAPLFSQRTTRFVTPYSVLHVAYKTTTRHSTKCVSEYDAEMRRKSIYEDENRQYLHSLDSCMESCFQNISYADPACAFCYKPEMLGKLSPKERSVCNSLCPWVEKESLWDNHCDCQPSCNSTIYSVQTLFNSFKLPRPKYEVEFDAVIEWSHKREKVIGDCGIKVYPMTNIEKETFTAPKMNLVTLLALIGGIISLLQPALLIVKWTHNII